MAIRSDSILSVATCTRAPSPRPAGPLAWSPNRCGNAVWALDAAPPAEAPITYRPGSAYLRTVYPVRMAPGGELEERCTMHSAWAAARERDGYWEAAACGESAGRAPYSVAARCWTVRRDSRKEGGHANPELRNGYTYFVGAYPTPRWVEAIFAAPLERCAGAPV